MSSSQFFGQKHSDMTCEPCQGLHKEKRDERNTHAVSLLRPQPQEIADVIRRLKALSSQVAAFASPGGCCTALYPATGYAKGRAPKLNSHLSPASITLPLGFLLQS